MRLLVTITTLAILFQRLCFGDETVARNRAEKIVERRLSQGDDLKVYTWIGYHE